MGRPGIMLYFDMLEPIKVLPDADKGRLLVAMLEYGKCGIVPEFDGMLALAWGFVRPKIDKDEKEYNMSVLRRQYATVCRERKKKGEPEITFDEWLNTKDNSENQRPSMMTNDNQWYPTTTTPTSTSTSTATAAAVTATTSDAGGDGGTDSVLKVCGGTLGKGVVLLTEEQDADLLDRLGLDVYDYYMDKLSTYIIENNARIRNHYETILKWWKEDGRIQR